MPAWVQLIIGLAAVVTAAGVLWTRVLHPIIRFANHAEQMFPLLQELTMAFRNTPNAFKVLDQIVAQFRTDSGSSLRDVVNRLEDAANENRAAAERLKIGVETVKQLAEQDRTHLQQLIILLDRLNVKVDDAAALAAEPTHNESGPK